MAVLKRGKHTGIGNYEIFGVMLAKNGVSVKDSHGLTSSVLDCNCGNMIGSVNNLNGQRASSLSESISRNTE